MNICPVKVKHLCWRQANTLTSEKLQGNMDSLAVGSVLYRWCVWKYNLNRQQLSYKQNHSQKRRGDTWNHLWQRNSSCANAQWLFLSSAIQFGHTAQPGRPWWLCSGSVSKSWVPVQQILTSYTLESCWLGGRASPCLDCKEEHSPPFQGSSGAHLKARWWPAVVEVPGALYTLLGFGPAAWPKAKLRYQLLCLTPVSCSIPKI